MAVELGTTTHFNNNTQDGNNAFTIPADATAVIVIARGTFQPAVSNDFDELNWDDGATLDFTPIVVLSTATDADDVWAYIMTSTDGNWPGTGAQTLYFSTTGAMSFGIRYTIQAVTGIDTTTPVRDTDSAANAAQTWVASLDGVVTGDLTFICRGTYDGAENSITHGVGQVELEEAVFNGDRSAISTEDGEGAPEISSNVASNFDGNIAFALRAAVADIDHVAALAESFDNVVQRRPIKITSF